MGETTRRLEQRIASTRMHVGKARKGGRRFANMFRIMTNLAISLDLRSY